MKTLSNLEGPRFRLLEPCLWGSSGGRTPGTGPLGAGPLGQDLRCWTTGAGWPLPRAGSKGSAACLPSAGQPRTCTCSGRCQRESLQWAVSQRHRGHSSRGHGAKHQGLHGRPAEPRVLSVGPGRTRGLSSVPETHSRRPCSKLPPRHLLVHSPQPLPNLALQSPADLPLGGWRPPAKLTPSLPPSCSRLPNQACPASGEPHPAHLSGHKSGGSNAQATGPSTGLPPTPGACMGADGFSATCQHKGLQN